MKTNSAKKAVVIFFLAFVMTACSASFTTNTGTNNSSSTSNSNSNANTQNKTTNTENKASNTNTENKASNSNSNTSSQSTSGSKKEFKINNKTKVTITKLLVSEDGKTYAEFDIGSGIPAGASETLVWNKSTDKEKCNQWFKAVYSDGAESEPAKFNFCEEGVDLDFEE